MDNLVVYVVRDHKTMIFQTIIDKFSTGDSTKPATKNTTPLHVNLGELKITNGEIHYNDKQVPFVYYIKKGNFETPGKNWKRRYYGVYLFFCLRTISGYHAGPVRYKF
ncbi:MAG: hypothetical protein WDM78_03000 [Puia sp.]